jgi:hypothetical protein
MKVSTVTKRYARSPSEEEKSKVKELIKKRQKEDEKMVKGMFEFCDAGAGWFDFNYRIYPGEIYKFSFTHGEITEIPVGLMRDINNTYRKVRSYDLSGNTSSKQDADSMPGKGVPTIITKTSRIRFLPMDAM